MLHIHLRSTTVLLCGPRASIGPILNRLGPNSSRSCPNSGGFGPNSSLHCPRVRTYVSTSEQARGVNIVYGSLEYPFIVVDKQPGLGVQFRADRNADSLEKRLNALGKSCFFVNRLDAGLMVIAFSQEAASLLGRSMENQEWLKKYKVLATLPNWLHRFYTDFSLTFPNYNIHQPHKNQQINNSTKKLTKIIQKDETQKYQDNKQKALDFINQYIPNKSPFIYGELINNRMQLVKNGTLVSYFTRFTPILRPTEPTTILQSRDSPTNKRKQQPNPPSPSRMLSPSPSRLPSPSPSRLHPSSPPFRLSPSPPISRLHPSSPLFDVPSLWDYVLFSKGVIDDKLKPVLKKNPKHHSVPRKYDDLTKIAITQFELMAANFNHKYLLYEVVLQTGRTHQIRSHFSESGFPIFGDTLYSQNSSTSDVGEEGEEEDGKKEGEAIGLQAFHLSFPDPYNNHKRVTVQLALPNEFTYIMRL